jgi:hypothetical protein
MIAMFLICTSDFLQKALQQVRDFLVESGFAESPGFKPLDLIIRAIRKIRIQKLFPVGSSGCGKLS